MDWKCFLLIMGVVSLVRPIAFGLDVPKGCEVQDSLTISPLAYDSVRFEAYVRDSLPVFTARMTCTDHRFFDTLQMTSNHTVSLERKDHDWHETEAASLDNGWHNFELQVVGNYSLKDHLKHSWLPAGLEVKCVITKIVIDDGLFMRHCPDGTPAWKISGSRGKGLPLTTGDTRVKEEELILFSRTSFLPVFEVGKLSFKVGWEKGALKVVDNEDVNPILPFKQHTLYLELTTDSEDSPKVRVSDGFKTLFSRKLKAEPETLQVSERNGGSFILVQKTREGHLYCEDTGNFLTTEDYGLTEEYRSVRPADVSSDLVIIAGLSIGLLLSLSLVVGLGVRVFQQSRTAKKNQILRQDTEPKSRAKSTVMASRICLPGTSTLPNLSRHTERHDSLYLQPRPAKVPSWVPAIPSDPATCIPEDAKDLPEAVYEEIDTYQYMAVEGDNSADEQDP